MTNSDQTASPPGRPTAASRSRRGSLTPWFSRLPWIILGFGLAITALLWVNGRHQQREMLRADFRMQVAKVHAGLETRLQANEQILRGVAGLFAANGQVTRDQFRAYVTSLRLAEHYPGIRGVGFARRIDPADLAAQVAAIQAEGFSDFAVSPAGERAIYTAIVYLEPFDWRNRRAFGYDMFSEPVRREAMTRAWEEDRAALSGRVQLRQETARDVQAGFLIYSPVYRAGQPNETLAQRRANLLGWAYSPLRMTDLMQSFLQRNFPELTERLAIEIHDGRLVTPATRMFTSAPGTEPRAQSFQQTGLLTQGGHPWTLRLYSLPAFDRQAQRLTDADWILLGAGGGLSVSLALLAWILIRTHRRVTEALHEQARTHRALLEAQQRLQLIFDTSDVAIFLTDLEGRILQANARMAEMFRCPLGTLIGSDYVDHIHPAEREIGRQRMRELLARQTTEVKLERRYWRADESEFWGQLGGRLIQDADGHPLGLVGVIADTTQRKKAEAKIQYLAHHDYLTGLPNRALFVERVGQALVLAQRNQRQLGILFLDLNGFKPINDRHGHQAGDKVLREVAKRLRGHIRASDTVCRQGGDEFVILVPELPSPDHLEHLARTLATVIDRPYEIMGVSLSLTVSIGLAVYPDHGLTVDELLHSADAAMYQAKRDGPSRVRFAAPNAAVSDQDQAPVFGGPSPEASATG
ncbi:CHASE domain-containing protein [Thiocystis violacea]|uniref:CHASE domain-containing protein n=1 Tax=Thiocystis violacea TaxID=13725 RepID=UPI0019048E0C|nr:CHASE domain-containing protein [Thiocystis violacea]